MQKEQKEPFNFSWIVEGQLCGFGFPERSSNVAFLYNSNVRCIINLTEWTPPLNNFPAIEHVHEEVVEFEPPSLEQVSRCVNAIQQAIGQGKAAGVHCRHGWGRTGTILACYLVKAYDLSGVAAIQKIREMRPWSIETEEQEQAVIDYEIHLKSRETPKTDL